jgi:hypothetical protein
MLRGLTPIHNYVWLQETCGGDETLGLKIAAGDYNQAVVTQNAKECAKVLEGVTDSWVFPTTAQLGRVILALNNMLCAFHVDKDLPVYIGSVDDEEQNRMQKGFYDEESQFAGVRLKQFVAKLFDGLKQSGVVGNMEYAAPFADFKDYKTRFQVVYLPEFERVKNHNFGHWKAIVANQDGIVHTLFAQLRAIAEQTLRSGKYDTKRILKKLHAYEKAQNMPYLWFRLPFFLKVTDRNKVNTEVSLTSDKTFWVKFEKLNKKKRFANTDHVRIQTQFALAGFSYGNYLYKAMMARERKTPVPSLFDVLKEQTAVLFQQGSFDTPDLQYSVIDKECYEKILETLYYEPAKAPAPRARPRKQPKSAAEKEEQTSGMATVVIFAVAALGLLMFTN